MIGAWSATFPDISLFKVHGSRDFVCRIGLCSCTQVTAFAVDLQRQIDLLSRRQESEFDLLELRVVR
jgi:hypothetical protein